MDDTIDVKSAAESLAKLYEVSGRVWKGYGTPSAEDCEAAIVAVIDHLSSVEGDVAMELPNTGIKVDRSGDGHSLFFRVGLIGDENV